MCQRWRELAQDEAFRTGLYFKWLLTVHDWENASEDLKENYYVVYELRRCLGCNKVYKDTPGFMQIRKRGSLRFYSDSDDAGHPGYCSQFCASVMGAYRDSIHE